jgi:hypothetical protein
LRGLGHARRKVRQETGGRRGTGRASDEVAPTDPKSMF